MYIRCASDIN